MATKGKGQQPGAPGSQSEGPATDANNVPVVDPTENVLRLVDAAIQRQDDLRSVQIEHIREIVMLRAAHATEVNALRSKHGTELRLAEAARIDAIRAVDVGNVSRAAEVAAQQAQALATQLSATAETMRATTTATATAGQTSLAAALEPIQRDVADLRRVQFEQQGAKVAQRDDRDVRTTDRSQSNWLIGVIVGVVLFVAAEFLRRGGG